MGKTIQLLRRPARPCLPSLTVGLLTLLLPLVMPIAVSAQTTSFTYQGKLTDGGMPANGNYDLQFALWDSASGGGQVGSTQTVSAVAVSNGIFTVTLDFGAVAFPGANRFLEIGVRLAGSGNPFTLLSPRQQITSTPYAVRSLNASSADSVPVNGLPAGNGNYIQNTTNTTTQQSGASFNIDGNGTAGGTLSGNVVNSTTQYNLAGNPAISITGGTLFSNSNTFVGVGAGASNTPKNNVSSGNQNSFFGQLAGNQNTTGAENSFFGAGAGANNQGGIFNSFFGQGAGSKNTQGSQNAFFGASAGSGSTMGDSNSAFGRSAGELSTGTGNSFFGALAGLQTTGDFNSFFGGSAGENNGAGTLNTFIGYGAGNPANTPVNYSTAIGVGARVLTDHTIVFGTAAENVVVPGTLSKLNIAAQDGLQISGYQPFLTLNDTFAGNAASYIQGAQGDLIFIPQSFHPNSSAMVIKNSSGGVGIGTSSPNHHLAVIGGPAWTQASWAGAMEFANASAMGWQANAAGWHFGIGQTNGGLYFFQSQSQLGTTSSLADYIMTLTDQGLVGINTTNPNTTLTVNGCVSASNLPACGSDARLKQNIRPLSYGLREVLRLRPVRWQWKDRTATDLSLGLVAQQVEPVLPELVLHDVDRKGSLGLNYTGLIPVLVKGIQEQQSQIEQQHAEATEQQNEIAALRAANAALNARLRAVEQSLRKRGRSARRPR